MYQKLTRLLIYRNIAPDSILYRTADCIRRYRETELSRDEAVAGLYGQVYRLLAVATEYGFDGNLWQDYLAYLLATSETPFSVLCERRGAGEGSVNRLAKEDFRVFLELFHYDFSALEKELQIDCFSVLASYHAMQKDGKYYNRDVSEKVRALSRAAASAKDADTLFAVVTEFYRHYGVGLLGLNKAFRLEEGNETARLCPITNTEEVRLSDLIGYEGQKKRLLENTRAFVEGRRANNVLLYGDSGTGKSTSIKALLNEFYPDGLRMIELYKHQFGMLSSLISQIKNRNYRFIIFMDDLSFEEFETEYKYLKAVIEGGLEIKPDNVLIYATSNRRHLIRETWGDRADVSQDELHRSDTMQEKLSLVARFGLTIHYGAPDKKEFNEIVKGLASNYPELTLTEEELLAQANRWELTGGGLSGRTAQQYINALLGTIL